MAEEIRYEYEKYEEDGSIKWCPMNDLDGKITGHIVLGVRQWFDEHPEERKRLGWIKHIHHSDEEVEYNRQSQYLIVTPKIVDQ